MSELTDPSATLRSEEENNVLEEEIAARAAAQLAKLEAAEVEVQSAVFLAAPKESSPLKNEPSPSKTEDSANTVLK